MLEKDHVKPDGSTMDYEKNLARIATRGVVKLFNAVSKHQKEMESKLQSAPTEAKKSKVVESMSKSAFLDMLKSSSDKDRTQEINKEEKTEANDRSATDNSSWNILRDDFMMGAKMKDWNREEQQTKRKDKKVSNITDHELEISHADFFDESDEGDNEDSDSNSDEG
ncbi:RRP15-like protein [Oculina patagonica]